MINSYTILVYLLYYISTVFFFISLVFKGGIGYLKLFKNN